MGVHSMLYNALFKRTSTYVLTIAVGVFIFERTMDIASDEIWDSHNKGKLWKDIKGKYET